MRRRLLAAAAGALLALATPLSAPAQEPLPSVPRAGAADPSSSSPTSSDKPDHLPAAAGLTIAALSSMLVLFIICKPTRKN